MCPLFLGMDLGTGEQERDVIEVRRQRSAAISTAKSRGLILDFHAIQNTARKYTNARDLARRMLFH